MTAAYSVRRLPGIVACILAGAILSQGSPYFCSKDGVQLEVRTTLAGGLFNQHGRLLSFLTLATHLSPDRLSLTGATKRDTFEKISTDMVWTQVPLGSLWDMDSISSLLAEYGIEHVAPDDNAESICEIERLPSLFRHVLPPSDVIELWKQHISNATPHAMLQSGNCARIVQDVADTFLAIQTKRSWRYAEVASKVDFNGTIKALASRIVEGIAEKTGQPAGTFTGVHLRMEYDALPWYDGEVNTRENIMRHFKEVVYNFPSNTIYIAGAFNETIEPEASSLFEQRVITKRNILGHQLLSELHSEQLALLDFLVLSEAQYFVGYMPSSMSYFCQEYRMLQGKSRLTSYLIDAHRDRYQFNEAMAVLDRASLCF